MTTVFRGGGLGVGALDQGVEGAAGRSSAARATPRVPTLLITWPSRVTSVGGDQRDVGDPVGQRGGDHAVGDQRRFVAHLDQGRGGQPCSLEVGAGLRTDEFEVLPCSCAAWTVAIR